MANPSKTIDMFSQRIEKAFGKIRDELGDIVEQLAASGTSAEQIVQALASPDLRADLGFGRESLSELFERTATQVLAAAPALGASTITPEMIEALTTIAEQSFLAHADRYWTTLQKELTSSVISGSTTGLRKTLQGIEGLQAHQVEAAFNTTLNTYSSSVGAEVARNDPPSAKYTYEGPMDDRTRDECLAMGAAGPLTRDEIERNWPGAFIDRGGYNCRHQWVPVAAAADTNTKGAKHRIDEKKKAGKWREPISVRQKAEAKSAGTT